MKNYIYLRVSTSAQDKKSQLVGIANYMKQNNITEVITYTDTASGSIPWDQRSISHILKAAEPNDLLMVSEISRIGRSTGDVLTFLSAAAAKGLKIHAVKNNITLDASIQSTIFATVLGLAAEIEREFIKSRTKEGMQRARELGKVLGRPKGSLSETKINKKAEQIAELLQKKIGKSAIARMLGVSRGTVERQVQKMKVQP